MIYTFVDYVLDTQRQALYHANTVIKLEPKVYQVLVYLIEHHQRLVTKAELLDQFWADTYVNDNAVARCIRALRRALDDSRHTQRIIQTQHRQGYRFVAPVTELDHIPVNEAESTRPVSSKPGLPHQPKTPLRQRQHAVGLARDRSSAYRFPPVSPFVGRDMHLSWCDYALDDVAAGHPNVMVLQGEAGMGKTRLLKEIQDVAQRRGLQIYSGRCSETFSLPYMPFINALREPWEQLASQLEPELGGDIALISQWLQLGTHPAVAASPLTADEGEQAKLRLFLAVARAFVLLAQRQPMLFVIDDLHWADSVSLELCAHLVFTAVDMAQNTTVPLLFIGTHRPVQPQDRLAPWLARLQREPICEFLELPGFEEEELHILLQGLGIARASQQLVHTLHEVASGNPLFVQELLQYLQQRNALHTRGGYVVTTTSSAELRLPDQITSTILTRVQALSSDCRQTLITAALLGDPFSLEVLSDIRDADEEVVLSHLEEALHQSILQSEGQTFNFAHPLMRHVLYHIPSVTRRQRLHWQIAQTLERLDPARHHDRSLQLAHHLVRAGPVADADTLVQYVRQAGDHAFAMLDWQHASHFYETVLTTATQQTMQPSDVAELHYRAGIAYARDGNVGLSDVHLDQSIATYRSIGDVHGQAQALIEKMLRMAAASYGTLLDTQPLEELIEELGEDHLSLRGRLHYRTDFIRCFRMDI